MRSWLALFGGLIVVVATAAHIYVRLWMKPPDDDLDGYYNEFEEQHPAYRRYLRLRYWTFGAASIGVLLLFLASVL